MKTALFFLLTVLLLSCQDPEIEEIELQISRSAIPEGIAVHPLTEEIYISSIHEDHITRSSSDGSTFEKIHGLKDNGYSIGVGLDIWKNHLYALGKYKRSSSAILTIKDLKANESSTFTHVDLDTTYFNDLAITKQGNAFLTDTDNHRIYFFDLAKGKISTFLEDEEIKYPNGITISADQSKLFIDSYSSGIRIFDLGKKSIINHPHDPTTQLGIDGLKYNQGVLYMIVNGGKNREKHGLYALSLVQNETDFGSLAPILVNHDKMDIPTTFSIVDDHAYVLANSQLTNLDQQLNKIIDTQKLDKTYVLKVALRAQ
ncbi:MAG: SMP-30/gluconolactonase/LRE family protein [Flavobacteriaceae bacterium]